MNETQTVRRHVAPALEPITLEETKLFLRVEHVAEDALISRLIGVAREVAEEIMGTSLMVQQWKFIRDDYLPARLRLPYGPVTEIVSATKLVEGELPVTLNVARFHVQANGSDVLFDDPQEGGIFEVIYKAGLASTSSQVAAMVRQSLLQHVALLYSYRTQHAPDITRDVFSLYAPLRKVGL
jgi:uncharacterized phiE125 gp8 family phage protein